MLLGCSRRGRSQPAIRVPGLTCQRTIPRSIPPTTAIIPGGPVWSPLGGCSGACFSAGCGYTDWIQSTYTISSAGSYQFAFGVTNFLDTIFDSGLAPGTGAIGIPATCNAVEPSPVPACLAFTGRWWPTRLVAAASENRLSFRTTHTSFAAASDCRTIAIWKYTPYLSPRCCGLRVRCCERTRPRSVSRSLHRS
jgi:hypothetical protein